MFHALCPALRAERPGLRGSPPPITTTRPATAVAVWLCHGRPLERPRLVLLSIADRVADEQCVAWASLSSLVERTNASRSTVRGALDRLLDEGELELLDDLVGPQRSTVYRLPLAAEAVAEAAKQMEARGSASAEGAGAGTALRISVLRRYGIRPREVPESDAKGRNPAGPKSGTPQRKPAPRRTGFRPLGVPVSGPQNRSEPKVNRRYSSSGAAAVTSAGEWQADPDTQAWARQQGHLDRLGEEGLVAADAKWLVHRAEFEPRTAGAWAADWRSWIAREHSPTSSRPSLYALPGNGPTVGGLTRAGAYIAALRAALDEPNGTE